jgi:hypothetical protein
VRIESLSLVFYSPAPRDGSYGLELSPADFVKAGSAQLRMERGALDVTVTPRTYSAQLELPGGLRLVHSGNPALIAVRLKTSRASAGIGVLNQDGSAFIDRKALLPDDHVRTVYLGVDNISDASCLVIYGGDEPVPARIQVESVSIAL